MTQKDLDSMESDKAVSGLDRTSEGAGSTTLGENADAAQSGMDRGGNWAEEEAKQDEGEPSGMAEGEEWAQDRTQESFEQAADSAQSGMDRAGASQGGNYNQENAGGAQGAGGQMGAGRQDQRR